MPHSVSNGLASAKIYSGVDVGIHITERWHGERENHARRKTHGVTRNDIDDFKVAMIAEMVSMALIVVAQYDEIHPTARTGGGERKRPALHRQCLEALIAFTSSTKHPRAHKANTLHSHKPTHQP